MPPEPDPQRAKVAQWAMKEHGEEAAQLPWVYILDSRSVLHA